MIYQVSQNPDIATDRVASTKLMQKADFQKAIDQLVPEPRTVISVQRVAGGCISDAFQLEITTPTGSKERWFLKTNKKEFYRQFLCELDGLSAIKETSTLAVPQVIASGITHEHAWLVLDWIEQTSKSSKFFLRLGQQLAEMHRCKQGDQYGWRADNYLGSSLQKNTQTDSWPDFVAEHRIEFQLKMAHDHLQLPSDLERMIQSIISRMSDLLNGSEKKISLLHGDLWSGNYLSNANGSRVLIDPAVYHGNREAEFGMILLFGSCPPAFYDAYQENYPLTEGWQRRCKIHTLYHLLNHLNLFGLSYLDDCRRICHQILGSK